MKRGVALPFVALLGLAVGLRLAPPEPAPSRTAPQPPPFTKEIVPFVTPPPAPAPPAVAESPATSHVYVEPTLSAKEILPLVEARFPDETILAVARVTGRPFRPTSDEADALRRAGMSDILLGRLRGDPPPPAPAPAPPPVVVYAPVTVTVVNEPAPPPPPPVPEPEVVVTSGVVTCVHGRFGCCPPPVVNLPPIYAKEPFFKTREFMPTKPLPTAEEVERREKARSTRIYR
jgi:hypothetical protein